MNIIPIQNFGIAISVQFRSSQYLHDLYVWLGNFDKMCDDSKRKSKEIVEWVYQSSHSFVANSHR